MNRRDLLRMGVAAIASAGAVKANAPLAASAMGSRVDTLTLENPDLDVGPVRDGGMSGAVVDLRIYPRGTVEAKAALERWTAVDKQSTSFGLVRRPGDFQKLAADGLFAIMLASQDAAILGPSVYSVGDGNLENLRDFYQLGLRVLQLTHNERNGVGDGFREKIDAGLSRLGEAVVAEMNRLGMLIDLSHCSDLTTRSAIQLSNKPVAVTHSGCRALYDSRRNKPDDLIRAIAERGGYFGVFMMTRWLTHQPQASADDVVDHICHAIKVGGEQAVGFGSDQPLGGDPTPQTEKVRRLAEYQQRNHGLPGAEPLNRHITASDMDGPNRMLVLEQAMRRRGFKSALIDRILGGNFLQVADAAMSGSNWA